MAAMRRSCSRPASMDCTVGFWGLGCAGGREAVGVVAPVLLRSGVVMLEEREALPSAFFFSAFWSTVNLMASAAALQATSQPQGGYTHLYLFCTP